MGCVCGRLPPNICINLANAINRWLVARLGGSGGNFREAAGRWGYGINMTSKPQKDRGKIVKNKRSRSTGHRSVLQPARVDCYIQQDADGRRTSSRCQRHSFARAGDGSADHPYALGGNRSSTSVRTHALWEKVARSFVCHSVPSTHNK